MLSSDTIVTVSVRTPTSSRPASPRGAPAAAAPAGAVPEARVVIRQAEQRTQLVVQCAALVSQLQQLDADVAQYDEWQRYPNMDYAQRVQLRFEEARRREAAGQGSAFRGTSASPRGSPRGNLPAVPAPEDNEAKAALTHLQRALRSVEYEAEVWRQRAIECETANEREREQAKRLMEFELASALKEADRDKSQLTAQLRDQEAQISELHSEVREYRVKGDTFRNAFETLELQHRALTVTHDTQQDALNDARKRVDEHVASYKHLTGILETRDADVWAARKELKDVRAEGDAHRERVTTLESQVRMLQADRDVRAQSAETHKAEVTHLTDVVTARELELVNTQHDLKQAVEAAEERGTRLERIDIEIQMAVQDRDRTQEALKEATRRAELLAAKVENYEVALEAGAAKQADLVIERDAHKLRADRHELSASGASTAAPSTASSMPGSPSHSAVPLPPPPSASLRSPKAKFEAARHLDVEHHG